jgi:trehalose-phosphatase
MRTTSLDGSRPDLPPGLEERLASARSRLLVLDYDGTLSPLRLERDRARPVPGVPATLRSIAGQPGNRVAVISGRPVEELARLLFDRDPPDSIALIGEHGWERLARGEVVARPLPVPVAKALEDCARSAAARGWEKRVERKRTAVVLHTRGLPEAEARALEAGAWELWTAWASGRGLRVERMDGGVEARPAGYDKGSVTLELLEETGPDAVAVYVGDDVSDEDAFVALRGRGFGLRVARDRRETAATGSFGSCEELAAWLARWPGAPAAAPEGGSR